MNFLDKSTIGLTLAAALAMPAPASLTTVDSARPNSASVEKPRNTLPVPAAVPKIANRSGAAQAGILSREIRLSFGRPTF